MLNYKLLAYGHTISFLTEYHYRIKENHKEFLNTTANKINDLLEENRAETILGMVNGISKTQFTLSDILNLILYTGAYWKAHRFNYATNTATVYLTARDGYYYELKGVSNNGTYTWTYEYKKAGY